MPLLITTTSDFDKNVKRLKRRFRRIDEDLMQLVNEMSSLGYRGDFVPRIGRAVYKARLSNRSAGRGKSGGFRVLYTTDGVTVRFVHIYSKTDKADESASEIKRILANID